MKKIEIKETTQTPADKVYETMLGLKDKSTYEKWTAIFNPTSTFEGSWQKGEKMYFIGVDENGKRGGMIAEIAENKENKFVSIRHYGMLDGDKEITSGELVDSWAGTLENYTFEEVDGKTTVTISMNADENHMSYFTETWPAALKVLKAMIEG